jgi:hypothetical protein
MIREPNHAVDLTAKSRRCALGFPAGHRHDGADALRRAIGPASQSALMRREAPAYPIP